MISSLGVGSGLDLQGLVQQIISAEGTPASARLNSKEAGLQTELSAFGSLKAAADGVKSALEKLKSLAPGRTAALSGNAGALTASAGSNTPLGIYNIEVSNLAKTHSMASAGYATTDTVVGTGTLSIQFGTTTYDSGSDIYSGFVPDGNGTIDIEITTENNTLSGVRDAINAADAGVTAVIVNDASGNRLLLTSDKTGAENSIEVTVTDDDGTNLNTSGLSALAFNASATNLQQTVAGENAAFNINGLDLTSGSNSVAGAIDGLTLELASLTEGDPAIVKVNNNESAVNSAIQEFIGAYNEFFDLADQLDQFDAETGVAGVLFGDITLRGLKSSLRSAISGTIESQNTQLDSLLQLGIDPGELGRLDLDSEAFSAAVDADFEATVSFIQAAGDSLETVLDRYVGSDGLIENRTEGVQSRLEDIGEDRSVLVARLERMETRLVKQFASLDTLLADLQNTSNFLTQQLSNVAAINNSNRSG